MKVVPREPSIKGVQKSGSSSAQEKSNKRQSAKTILCSLVLQGNFILGLLTIWMKIQQEYYIQS